mmetsp:Transcript_5859/g.24493  ORF Transcript_5859/g.24493 Transcript_5859/m.24493 type:complete len:456 (-) Transcript_5859:835-2202(-)
MSGTNSGGAAGGSSTAPARAAVLKPKSRFQREKEEREAKRRAQESEAAKMYEQFVASFDAGDRHFVRASGSSKGNGDAREPTTESSRIYRMGSSSGPAAGRDDDPERRSHNKDAAPNTESRRQGSSAPVEKAGPPTRQRAQSGRRRQIDSFLEELKSRQERDAADPDHGSSRGGRRPPAGGSSSSSAGDHPFDASRSRGRPHAAPSAYGPSDRLKSVFSTGADDLDEPFPAAWATSRVGSHDDGDPETTNLYVGNLAPGVTEEMLAERFGRFGAIDSVKIMWPRTDEERQRRRNCGFVSFARRDDADAARASMNDADLEGYRLAVGWGKAVPRPQRPPVSAARVARGMVLHGALGATPPPHPTAASSSGAGGGLAPLGGGPHPPVAVGGVGITVASGGPSGGDPFAAAAAAAAFSAPLEEASSAASAGGAWMAVSADTALSASRLRCMFSRWDCV